MKFDGDHVEMTVKVPEGFSLEKGEAFEAAVGRLAKIDYAGTSPAIVPWIVKDWLHRLRTEKLRPGPCKWCPKILYFFKTGNEEKSMPIEVETGLPHWGDCPGAKAARNRSGPEPRAR